MFGWNKRGGSRRNSAFIKKLKRLGRPAVGKVASVVTQNELRAVTKLPLEDRLPYTVVITFSTEQGKQEQLVMHTRDVSSYAVGFEVPVIYFYEKGICLAAPASVL